MIAAGTGAVARDEHGEFIVASAWFIPHAVLVDAVEMIAIRNGFYLAAKIGCNSLHIESNSSNAVEALNLEAFLGQDSATLLECKEMGLDFGQYEVTKCPQEANSVADCIAKASLSNRSSEVWEEAIPDFISHLIVNDLGII
ncbi:uncharacterized protein [Aegilops tauschii subsp. strangulata]|uniref:uncharacterized protein n=1 Tax=Aegilops tauschii subsp. strangulata TaxID=200361 RepID=UPI003CC895E3